jgi:3-hydroxyacyl-[acyl-carrier-protein] dehydratase
MSAAASPLDLLPHRAPMRLVETLLEVVPGVSARTRRIAQPGDWYFQGHFPGDPVVPAIALVEFLAQTGGIAASSAAGATTRGLRVAAFGGFKFPGAARPHAVLEATARVAGRMGGMIKIEGEVEADGVRVAAGSLVLAEAPAEPPAEVPAEPQTRPPNRD